MKGNEWIMEKMLSRENKKIKILYVNTWNVWVCKRSVSIYLNYSLGIQFFGKVCIVTKVSCTVHWSYKEIRIEKRLNFSIKSVE